MIRIIDCVFNPWQEIEHYQCSASLSHGKYGATQVFVGTMRDFNEGDGVSSMVLEYYPGMTEKQLEKIAEEAHRQSSLLDVLILHRVGEIFPGEPIVLAAVWSTHRGDAFDAVRYIMEALKSRAPFWKKERLHDACERWVEKNTDGYA
ncbi:MAG: molybdenum cofactor biosynthesis protein MoaE [Gammaproteobacteria bacterium]